MKTITLLFTILFNFITNNSVMAQQKHILYLIPGTGADHRLFNQIAVENCELRYIKYEVPDKNESLEEYAHRLAQQIDVTSNYSIAGVSLGGMITAEMSKFMNAEKFVLISSAKNKQEVPLRIRCQKYLPFYRMFGGKMYKKLTKMAMPIFEPKSSKEVRATCASMLDDTDPLFLERAVKMIVKWENIADNDHLIRIHGTKDQVFPYRKIENPITVDKGSHLMIQRHPNEINKILNDIFSVAASTN